MRHASIASTQVYMPAVSGGGDADGDGPGLDPAGISA
jgi:hypothetical protein